MKKILLTIRNFYGNLSLRNKLLLSYLVLILLLIGLLTVFSFRTLYSVKQQQIEFSSRQMLEQTAELLSYRISNINYVSEQIFFSNTVNRILVQDANLPISPDLMGDFNEIQNLIVRQFKKNDMDKLTLYVRNSVFYSHYESTSDSTPQTAFSNMDYIENEPWYNTLKQSLSATLWLPASYNPQSPALKERVISCVRLIRDNNDRSNIIAVLRIDILESKLSEIVRRACATTNSRAVLKAADGTVLACSNTGFNSGDPFAGVKTDNALTFTVKVDNTDWNLISVVPYSEVSASGNSLRTELALISAIICVLAWAVAYWLSGSVTKRVKSLTKRIKKIQNGDFSSSITVSGNDEISELSHNYNFMLEQLHAFSEQQYRSGQELKNAELTALQAQINPHFLYNTLELINWTALEKNVPQISEIVLALAKYYKLSLSKGRDVVSISDEITHIETYVKLQNFRYPGAVELFLDVDSELRNYSIPKLIMQPIVENAIIHGILETNEKRGSIHIRGKLAGDIIIFNIRDTGVGMSDERCDEILRNQEDDNSGYGIRNVDARIRLFYGNGFGISYIQPEERGCEAVVKIAAHKFIDKSFGC